MIILLSNTLMAKYLNTDIKFKDRNDAGKKLANELSSCKLKDPIVVALPRGGVLVAKPISDILNATLDVMVSKKIGAPGNPELALGAVTSHGDYIISPYSETELGEGKWDYLQKQIVYLVNDSKEREKQYKEKHHVGISLEYPFKDKNVILVDDGTATGMTALAAIKSIKRQNPKQMFFAVPVISSQAYDEIENHVDKIIALKIPRDFVAVGAHYKDFSPVTDDEIKTLLS